jgi:hypothetical protein
MAIRWIHLRCITPQCEVFSASVVVYLSLTRLYIDGLWNAYPPRTWMQLMYVNIKVLW